MRAASKRTMWSAKYRPSYLTTAKAWRTSYRGRGSLRLCFSMTRSRSQFGSRWGWKRWTMVRTVFRPWTGRTPSSGPRSLFTRKCVLLIRNCFEGWNGLINSYKVVLLVHNTSYLYTLESFYSLYSFSWVYYNGHWL